MPSVASLAEPTGRSDACDYWTCRITALLSCLAGASTESKAASNLQAQHYVTLHIASKCWKIDALRIGLRKA